MPFIFLRLKFTGTIAFLFKGLCYQGSCATLCLTWASHLSSSSWGASVGLDKCESASIHKKTWQVFKRRWGQNLRAPVWPVLASSRKTELTRHKALRPPSSISPSPTPRPKLETFGNKLEKKNNEKHWYIKATSSTAETCGTCKTEENDFNAIFRPRSSLTKKDAMKSLNRMPLMHNATNSWRFVSGSNARSPGKLTMEHCITVSLSSIEHTYSHAPCSLARFYYANELNGNLRCSIVMSKISTQLDWVWWHKCNTSSDRSRILSSLTKCFVVAWLINQQPPNIPPQSNGLIGGYVREWVGWPATIQKDTKDIHGRSSHDAGDNLSSFSTLKLCHRTLFVGSRNRPSLKAASASLCGWKDGDV